MPTKTPLDRLLRPAEVAQIWCLSTRTVQRRIATGELRAMRLQGGHYRIHPDDGGAILRGACAADFLPS